MHDPTDLINSASVKTVIGTVAQEVSILNWYYNKDWEDDERSPFIRYQRNPSAKNTGVILVGSLRTLAPPPPFPVFNEQTQRWE